FAGASIRLPLVMVGLLQYLAPIGQMLVGTLIFHEPLPPERLAGFILVWIAILMLTTDSIRAWRASYPRR
ncbi:MAG: EamA family transporter RarD, partial [Bowdeniella nasicola]|nr:EamA family transporter RarD [Bowdeniella nasicola]